MRERLSEQKQSPGTVCSFSWWAGAGCGVCLLKFFFGGGSGPEQVHTKHLLFTGAGLVRDVFCAGPVARLALRNPLWL